MGLVVVMYSIQHKTRNKPEILMTIVQNIKPIPTNFIIPLLKPPFSCTDISFCMPKKIEHLSSYEAPLFKLCTPQFTWKIQKKYFWCKSVLMMRLQTYLGESDLPSFCGLIFHDQPMYPTHFARRGKTVNKGMENYIQRNDRTGGKLLFR